jgi:hypothetical protein
MKMYPKLNYLKNKKNYHMKKSIHILSIILSIVCIAVSCKKITDSDTPIYSKNADPLKTMGNELAILYEQVPDYDFGNITLVNGDILKFQSLDHYEKVYECLYDQYTAWTKIFLTYFYFT